MRFDPPDPVAERELERWALRGQRKIDRREALIDQLDRESKLALQVDDGFDRHDGAEMEIQRRERERYPGEGLPYPEQYVRFV